MIVHDHDNFEYMTRILIEEYLNGVNADKTETTCIEGEEQFGGERRTIQCCTKYKYLGRKITKDGTLDKTIKKEQRKQERNFDDD